MNLSLFLLNDVQGYLNLYQEVFYGPASPELRRRGGYARIATLLADLRQQYPITCTLREQYLSQYLAGSSHIRQHAARYPQCVGPCSHDRALGFCLRPGASAGAGRPAALPPAGGQSIC
jgi:hypothetical protein